MKRIVLALLTTVAFATAAQAHPSHHRHYGHHHRYARSAYAPGGGGPGFGFFAPWSQPQYGYENTRSGYNGPGYGRRGEVRSYGHVSGGRPTNCRGIAWCGCWLRDALHIADSSLNLALNWARKFPRTSPHVGAVVVWSHGGGHGHVGQIVGGGPGHWEIQSGNDGGAVRTRVRNISNAYAIVEARA